MEDVFMVLALVVSSVVIYQCSYKVLWFKVGSLFDIAVALPEGERASQIPRWDLDDSTFFYKFYSQYSVSSHRIKKSMRVLFSVAMVSYTLTVEIILWQIRTADVDQTAEVITRFVWPCVSLMLTTLLILAQPFFILISLLNKFYNDKYEIERLIIITCIMVASLIAFLSLLSFGPFRFSKSMLTKISIVGVTIMAFLSGVASVSTLYYTFLFIRNKYFSATRSKGLHGFNTSTSRSLLWTADEMIYEQIKIYEDDVSEHLSILRKVEDEPDGKSSIIREQLIEKISRYHLEIAKLEHRVHQSRRIIFIKKALHFCFLVYCIHKIIFTFTKSLPCIIRRSSTRERAQNDGFDQNRESPEWIADPLAITVARILDFFLFRFNYQYELDSLTKQISLFLSVSLFVCSLSTVATTISYLVAVLPTRFRALAMYTMQNSEPREDLPKFKKEESRCGKTPSIIKNLIVSELTGIYVVATVLSIRSNLPFEVSERVNDLLGERFTVPNIIIDSWFEIVYAMSCISTFVFVKIAERILSL